MDFKTLQARLSERANAYHAILAQLSRADGTDRPDMYRRIIECVRDNRPAAASDPGDLVTRLAWAHLERNAFNIFHARAKDGRYFYDAHREDTVFLFAFIAFKALLGDIDVRVLAQMLRFEKIDFYLQVDILEAAIAIPARAGENPQPAR